MRTFADRLQPSPDARLGATTDGRGVHFAVFSEHAEKVELCLFDTGGRHETARLTMPDCTNGVWHGYLAGAQIGLQYGYRVYGPYEPKAGLRFNGHKLLLDPYARQLAGELKWHDSLYGYRIGAKNSDLSFDRRDSAPHMPKAIVTRDDFDWGNDHPPRVPWSETVIYEVHVRGFTHQRFDLLEHDRGTFGALGHASTIDYLRRLGITAVELLPIHAFARDRHLLEKNLTNYWGYNTLAYFAPDNAYLSDRTLGQIKWAIQQLHAAGIEVILDVVYNHTCEGNELGPTLSLRGFDNSNYYRLLPDDTRYYINDTGCGNTLNVSHQRGIQLVMDSLRYWVQEFHIDGFRFDLGVTLGRESNGFDPGCGLFDAMLQDPILARVKLISEPWDIGPGGFQVGNHPAGFGEWNSIFRDTMRGYWRGDHGLRGAVADCLQGSANLFDRNRRHPWASVNFVTAHDGFTMQDVVSYNEKHNDANGEDNRDGNDNNISYNWGWEGATDSAEIRVQREKICRAFFTTLMISHGTPMLLAGDEFGQTQHGNNNAYCHDDELSWLDWSLLDTESGRARRDFVAQAIALRKRNRLTRAEYYQHSNEEIAPDLNRIFWFDERGIELQPDDWNNYTARLLGVRRCEIDLQNANVVHVLTVLFNADSVTHEFLLPAPALDYQCVLDTSRVDTDSSINADSFNKTGVFKDNAHVAEHAVMVLSCEVELQQLAADKSARQSEHDQADSSTDNIDAADGEFINDSEEPAAIEPA
ncbi:MAG TPA: glycogen debranching protein GlgX [Spongiibacteraceae bacterium]